MKKKFTLGALFFALATMGWVSWDKFFSYCARNPTDSSCPQVMPSPTPEPTAVPTVEPTPEPKASPTPLPTPTIEPTPTPTPAPNCMEESSLVVANCAGPQYGNEVLAATTKLGRLGPDCVANLKALATELRISTGKCAIGGIEAVFILRDDGLAEENHACYFKNGTWTGSGRGKFMYCHSGVSTPTSPPPEKPPVVTDDCPFPPCPARTYPNGTPRWRFNSREYSKKIVDTTPITVDQEPYCHATGQSPMDDGRLRAGCPMRFEGDPNRRAVEEWLLNGPPVTDAKNGATCRQVEDNPFQFYQNNGNCRLCNSARNVCTGWY